MQATAPTFVGAREDVVVAERAWEAAERCAGRPGRADPEVEIVRVVTPLEYDGVARTRADGTLHRIELDAALVGGPRVREVLVHEVAHAWVSDGPVALVEGGAELLADCIAGTVGGLAPLAWDDGRPAAGVDLRAWEKPADGVAPISHLVRTDAYLSAARFARAAAELVDPRWFWSGEALRWDALAGELGDDPRADGLLASLAAGAGLADPDRDGVSDLVEAWRGTDPARWELALAPGEVALPLDGTPVCGAPRSLRNALRGDVPPVTVDDRAGVAVARLLRPVAEAVGGAAIVPLAGGSRCASGPAGTVLAEDPAFADAVASVLAVVDAAADPTRTVVVLGAPRTGVVGGEVWLSSADLHRDGVARLLGAGLAARRLARDGIFDWSAAEALARADLRTSAGAP